MGHMISSVSDLTSGALTLRCALHWPDPAQRDRIAEIRDNLTARIAEADREGWLGEAEGLKISRASAEHKLAQIDRRTRTPRPGRTRHARPQRLFFLDADQRSYTAIVTSAATFRKQGRRRSPKSSTASWPIALSTVGYFVALQLLGLLSELSLREQPRRGRRRAARRRCQRRRGRSPGR